MMKRREFVTLRTSYLFSRYPPWCIDVGRDLTTNDDCANYTAV
jgi:hypothetical protein